MRATTTAAPTGLPSDSPAGVTCRLVDDLAGATAVSALFDEVWSASGLLRPATAMAILHAGGYVAGAWDGDALVGASVGFLGFDDETRADALGGNPGALQLHSHITGVVQPGRGVGLALKRHQAAWCRSHGVDVVTWTVDPLVARNAFFNHAKLGATAATYLVDHYGTMPDGVNRDVPTDRLLVRWDVHAPPPSPPPPTPPPEAVRLVERRADGMPVVRHETAPAEAALLAVALPPDVLALRRTDLTAARAWGSAVRDVLRAAFADGWVAIGATRDGHYLLRRSVDAGTMA